jgi:hypothetical protein
MPSVPQSLLWISLVVLWLFVLVPMLISKRDAVRRTSDVALATRVLNSATSARLKKRGPADGHRSDPDWQLVDEEDDDLEDGPSKQPVVVKAAAPAPEDDILDVDIVEEDSGALPVGAGGVVEEGKPEAEPEAVPEPVAEDEQATDTDDESEDDADDDGTSDEYEYVEDTSGLESEEDPPTAKTPPISSRRRLYESKTAAAVSARKYRFRKRVLLGMSLILMATTIAAVTVWPAGWWACGTAGTITIIYLAYLRRQTRIEERVRRRRMARMARSRAGVQNAADRDYDMPSRMRQPGAAVLEIDDEDPIFEHLDYAPGPMEYHLPKAAGQ